MSSPVHSEPPNRFPLQIALLALICQGVPLLSQAPELTTIPVDSPAFVFSPGNWSGDAGRSGSILRQTWNAYAYFRVAWESKGNDPTAKLLLDTSTYAALTAALPRYQLPLLAYRIDGVWKSQIPAASEIVIEPLAKTGKHELVVYLSSSPQIERWGSSGMSGLNVLRVKGLQLNGGSVPVPSSPQAKWALIVGDSITEGIQANELFPYSYLLGEALGKLGYEYGMSACGWSGWINKGDNPPGDVPGYYFISNSNNGKGGQYHDDLSRWNKIDGNGHSLLDSKGHLSGYGHTGQEPALIFINYGTNDSLHKSNPSDTRASIAQSLVALRAAAPKAKIVFMVPFGQYFAKEIREAVEAYNSGHHEDGQVFTLDLGVGVARNLAEKKGLMGGLHPNDRGHANLAAEIIPQIITILKSR
jgi:lysophospholipase L1-like esterase